MRDWASTTEGATRDLESFSQTFDSGDLSSLVILTIPRDLMQRYPSGGWLHVQYILILNNDIVGSGLYHMARDTVKKQCTSPQLAEKAEALWENSFVFASRWRDALWEQL